MGVESFQVELKPRVCFDSAVKSVESISFCRERASRQGARFYNVIRGQSIIEICVSNFESGGVKVNIRFSLCQPDEVDSYFLEVLHFVKKKTASELNILDAGVSDENRAEDELILALISRSRRNWVEQFGDKTGFFDCDEAIIRAADGYFH